MRKSKKAFKDFNPLYRLIAETLLNDGFKYTVHEDDFIFVQTYGGCFKVSVKIITNPFEDAAKTITGRMEIEYKNYKLRDEPYKADADVKYNEGDTIDDFAYIIDANEQCLDLLFEAYYGFVNVGDE